MFDVRMRLHKTSLMIYCAFINAIPFHSLGFQPQKDAESHIPDKNTKIPCFWRSLMLTQSEYTLCQVYVCQSNIWLLLSLLYWRVCVCVCSKHMNTCYSGCKTTSALIKIITPTFPDGNMLLAVHSAEAIWWRFFYFNLVSISLLFIMCKLLDDDGSRCHGVDLSIHSRARHILHCLNVTEHSKIGLKMVGNLNGH